MSASDIESNHLKVFTVPKNSRRVTIKKFIENQDLEYVTGCAFYELTKPEPISSDENNTVVVEELSTGKLITGPSVITTLGIPSSSDAAAKRFKLDPEVRTEYRIFVKSKSFNRILVPGTQVMYYDTSIDSLASTKRKGDSNTMAGPSKNVDENPRNKRLKKGDNTSTSDNAVSHGTVSSSTTSTPITLAVGNYDLIQVAFSFDTTGSMSACIERVKNVVKQTISRLMKSVSNIEIAVIAHGDYDTTFLMKMKDFTRDEKVLCDFVNNVERAIVNKGQGSFEEAYEYVLNKARVSLSWKDKANKCLVLIGDALPHEPNDPGNESGFNWEHEAQMLKDANVKVYAVKCLSWSETKPFWQKLANITSGYYLELHQFNAIIDFMIAISYRESDPQQLLQFQEEVRERDGGNLTRNLRQLFATLNDEPEIEDNTPADLTAVEPGVFQILDVDRNDSIRDFVIRQGAIFQRGNGYYEFTKPEEVQANKKIVLMDKATGDMFIGDRARELASIPLHQKGKKVKPPPSDKWIMFIQSNSYNRKLVTGTKFLYEASKDDVNMD